MQKWEQDPSARLDYMWTWSDWLNGDTIQEHSIIAPAGITTEDGGESDGDVVIWVSGGTLNKSYPVTCRIVTVGGRVNEQSAIFMIREQ